MKIGIITYHFAVNYGAILQCYALQSYLQENGYEVEILNYVNDKQEKNNRIFKYGGIKSFIINMFLLPFIPQIAIKRDKFRKFSNNYLNLSKRLFNEKMLKEYIDENKFDYIITGSDQVFNPNINDFDRSFLFPFKTNAKKISYAASTGNANAEDIKKIEKYIEDFYKISIREESDKNKFNIDLKSKIDTVCDPVILQNKEKWIKFVNENKKNKKKYLLCYFLHKDLFNREYKIAEDIANQQGLKMIAINVRYSRQSIRKNTLYDVGPEEFINLIANADYVCTDSFHGTIFSIIFNKNFSCFDTRKNINDSRRKNILKEMKLLNRMVYIENEKVELSDINYNDIQKNITKIREKAFDFLRCIK